jgi:hypothetical protein
VCGLSGLDGVADQPTLEDHGKDYRTNRWGTRGEEGFALRAKGSEDSAASDLRLSGKLSIILARSRGLTPYTNLRIFPIPSRAKGIFRGGHLSVIYAVIFLSAVMYVGRSSRAIYALFALCFVVHS